MTRKCQAITAAFIACASCACPAAAFAQNAAAPRGPVATSPATMPAAVPASSPSTQPHSLVRRDTPINALITHAIAMSRGDAAVVRDSYLANGPDETALVEAFAGMAEVIPRVRAAAERRYGKDGFTAIGFGAMIDEEVRRLSSAATKEEESPEGRIATVVPPSQGQSWIALIKNANTGGQWKIWVARTFPINLRRRTDRLRAQTAAYEELAREIDAGKYPLALDARMAGRQKVQAAHRKLDEQTPSPAGEPPKK